MTSPTSTKNSKAEAAVVTLYVLGLGVWASALLVAGAIVAPVVFRVVPSPTSGDAMAIVFQRIDKAALGLSVLLVACEGTLAVLRRKLERSDIVRMVLLALMVGGALAETLYYTPQIAALHLAGITRDTSPGGLRMDELHHGASRIGSSICILALFAGFAQILRLSRRESS